MGIIRIEHVAFVPVVDCCYVHSAVAIGVLLIGGISFDVVPSPSASEPLALYLWESYTRVDFRRCCEKRQYLLTLRVLCISLSCGSH